MITLRKWQVLILDVFSPYGSCDQLMSGVLVLKDKDMRLSSWQLFCSLIAFSP